MPCWRCRDIVKNWKVSGPECAFNDAGLFRANNWNCATMEVLRNARPDAVTVSDDYSALILPFPGQCSTGDELETHLVIQWYKRRGRTQLALVIDANGASRPLRQNEAEQLADYYVQRPGVRA